MKSMEELKRDWYCHTHLRACSGDDFVVCNNELCSIALEDLSYNVTNTGCEARNMSLASAIRAAVAQYVEK